jgi:uncharacterized SAM-binding protein YcdF (DUF218 family)
VTSRGVKDQKRDVIALVLVAAVKKISYIALIFIVVIGGYLFFISHKMKTYSHAEAFPGADYIIVLGAQVMGDVPSAKLRNRIEVAIDYLKDNPNTIAFLSGGQGSGENISEAQAMYTEMTRAGISDSRLILEDKSTSTVENISFTKALMSPDLKKGIVVTNDFHIFRAIKTAQKQGLDVSGLSAKTPKSVEMASNIREYMAITFHFLSGNI